VQLAVMRRFLAPLCTHMTRSFLKRAAADMETEPDVAPGGGSSEGGGDGLRPASLRLGQVVRSMTLPNASRFERQQTLRAIRVVSSPLGGSGGQP
jgi:hypothetical protein